MKTITFYSYKGGVGRSLALANMAMRLSELGQTVCILDFDLDAPGLQFKFKNYSIGNIDKGLVDYIYHFTNSNILQTTIVDYVTQLKPSNNYFAPISFISAGNIDSPDYWRKLAMIPWSKLFYSQEGEGVRFFLDLKAKIEKEINPQFLLIDSRTGITDIAGITLRLLADQVVILAINNEENLFGSKKIIKSLLAQGNELLDRSPKLNFVLTRVPFGPNEKEKEYLTIERLKQDFMTSLNVESFDLSVIHSDQQIEKEEAYLYSSNYELEPGSVSNDYLKLFELIIDDQLHLDQRFIESRKAEIEYHKSRETKDLAQKLLHINKAIELVPNKHFYYIQRGIVYAIMTNYSQAIEDHLKARELNNVDAAVPFNLGLIYYELREFEKSLYWFDLADNFGAQTFSSKGNIYRYLKRYQDAVDAYSRAISINPYFHQAYNGRADALRMLKHYPEAIADIMKAIQITSDQPTYFGTLAEINADLNKIEEFYLNLTVALSKGLKATEMQFAHDVYLRFAEEPRFKELLAKYDIPISEVLIDGYLLN